MTVQEAVAILRAHNEWRRGNTTESLHDPMPYSPAELGVAIDVLCDHVDSPHAPNPLTDVAAEPIEREAEREER